MLTDRERELLKHALGYGRSLTSYRNRFVAAPNSDDGRAWASLAERGLAKCTRKGSELFGGDCYVVTEAGKAELFSGPVVVHKAWRVVVDNGDRSDVVCTVHAHSAGAARASVVRDLVDIGNNWRDALGYIKSVRRARSSDVTVPA